MIVSLSGDLLTVTDKFSEKFVRVSQDDRRDVVKLATIATKLVPQVDAHYFVSGLWPRLIAGEHIRIRPRTWRVERAA